MQVLAGQVAKPAVFGVADPVLHPGVLALPELEGGDVVPASGGVGEQDLEAVAVEVGEAVRAPGWGRSRRQMTREPDGQERRSSRAVSSMSSPLPRSCPSALIAGVQAPSGTSSMASWIF